MDKKSKPSGDVDQMRRVRKSTEREMVFKLSVLCVLAMGFGMFGFLISAIATSLWAGRVWTLSRRELMKMDIEIAMAEMESEYAVVQPVESSGEKEIDRAAAEIAGIEFRDPAGRYGGVTVYGEALKEGRRYLYAGLAGPADEPGPKTLIVNGMLYQLDAGTA